MTDLHLDVEGIAQPGVVRHLEGRERIQHAHDFRILATFSADLDEVAVSGMIGAPAALRLGDDDGSRHLGGVLTEVAFVERIDGAHNLVELRFRSRLALLRERRTSRIHQDATAPEIIGRILDLHGIPYVLDLARTFVKRETCAQYRETDLELVERLCAEESLAFFVADGAAGNEETIVLCDRAAAFPTILGSPEMHAPAGQVHGDAMGQKENDVRVVDVRRRVGAGSALVQRYDPMRPLATLQSAARFTWPKTGAGEVATLETFPRAGDDRGLIYEHHADDDAVRVERDDASLLLGPRRHQSFSIRAESPCMRLGPGRRIHLSGPEWASASGDLLLTEVSHRFRAEGLPGRPQRYEATLVAIPAAVFPAPKRRQRRRPIEVVQTGVVVGPSGEEVFTDELGRVRVQLHWDLDGRRDPTSSSWIRVAQAWAGNGFGAAFLPRVGMEVLVTFIGGDPDRPVVTGCLHHAAHPPPFAHPATSTTSGILSRSTPGGDGASEIAIDDAKGREVVRIRSEKDLELASKDDTRFDVGKDRVTNVKGDDTLVVDGGATVRVAGGLSLEVQGESRSLSLGDVSSTLMGRHDVHHQDLSTVAYAVGAVTTSSGPMTVHVEGEASLVVGTGETLASANVDGRLILGASKTVTLRAEETITLQVGTTVLEISQDGLRIEAKNVTIKAESFVAEGDGPKLTLGSDAEILTSKMTILTKKGGLVMEDKTELWGKPLALNPPPTQIEADESGEEPETKPFKVKLTDPAMEPYAGKHYVLFAEGLKLDGETAGDGGIDAKIPKAATSVDLTCWIDEFPTGRQRTWTIAVEALPPAAELRGALIRLHNLGYFDGAIPEKAGPSEQAAIRWFQKDHDLEPTGDLGAETASELESVHGS